MIPLTWGSFLLWMAGLLSGAGAASAVATAISVRRATPAPAPAPEPVRRRSHVTAGVGLVEFDLAHPLGLDLRKIEALVTDLAEARNRAWPDERPLIVMTSAVRERSLAWARPITPDEARVTPEAGS